MIQRIQTVYLILVILFLGGTLFSSEIFSFLSEDARYVVSAYGVSEYNLDASEFIANLVTMPLYVGFIAMILIAFITIMSYKNLKRQFKLGRTLFGLYFVMLVSIILFNVFGDSMLTATIISKELGIGFFLFVVGFPFTFLANTGIKRDKALLSSLDRLR